MTAMKSPQPAGLPPDIRPPDLLGLQQQLQDLFGRHSQRSTLLPEFLYFLARLVNAGAVIFASRSNDLTVTEESLISKQAAGWSPDLADRLREEAGRAMAEGRPIITGLSGNQQVKILAVPVIGSGNSPQAISLALLLDRQSPELFVLILQLVATSLSLWQEKKCHPGIDAVVALGRFAAALVKALSASDRKIARSQVAAIFKDFFLADTAILASGERQAGECSLAVSSLASFDHRSPQITTIRQVVSECLQQRTILGWPNDPENPQAVNPSLILKALAADMHIGRTLCLPLHNEQKEITGVVILCWHDQRIDDNGKIHDFMAMEQFLAGLSAWLFPSPSPSKIAGLVHEPLRRSLAIVACLIACATVALVPMTYKVDADCLLIPQHVRFVVGQFNSILKEVGVSPGSAVTTGQKLARLDEKALELEIASFSADIQKARKVQDVHLAAGATAQAQIAGFEREGLEQKLAQARTRVSQLDIESPVDGIVIGGSLEQKIGGPINRGQELFQIASLASLTVEAFIDQEDIGLIRQDAETNILVDSFPQEKWQGTVTRILPQSEVRDGRHVFIIESFIDNDDGKLRPGMHGKMTISVGKKPLFWAILRKPWTYIVKVLQSF
jgi:hypothetical protein